MADRIVDLRKKAKPAEWEDAEKPSAPATSLTRAEGPVDSPAFVIEWSGREYEKRERTQGWYIALMVFASVLALFGFFTANYFFIAFVILGLLTLFMYEHNPSPERSFSVSAEGVAAGNSRYRFSDLKSFWIFKDPMGGELSLETKKTLNPFVRLPLRNVDGERVRMFLRNYLPEEEHREFITDQIAKNL